MEISPGPTAYDALKRGLARGWNTWNTRSVLSHVLLPEGVAVNLGIKEYRERSYLKESLIGRRGEGTEVVVPGPRSYDGRYTEIIEAGYRAAETGQTQTLKTTFTPPEGE